jgi:DNA primase
MRMAARILFPNAGFTTDDLVATYAQLGPVLLPHLADRPLTLKRFPDGTPAYNRAASDETLLKLLAY